MDKSAGGCHVPRGLIAAELHSAAYTATGKDKQSGPQYRCRQRAITHPLQHAADAVAKLMMFRQSVQQPAIVQRCQLHSQAPALLEVVQSIVGAHAVVLLVM